jgi:hypothetical protein
MTEGESLEPNTTSEKKPDHGGPITINPQTRRLHNLPSLEKLGNLRHNHMNTSKDNNQRRRGSLMPTTNMKNAEG